MTLERWRDEIQWPSPRRLGRAVFGDRIGLLVWLGLVLSLACLWRVGFFLTDSYTVANTLVNVADGHLAITSVEYSLTLGTQPGLHQYEGVLYGRNYGQAFLALPFVWLLEAGALVAAPRFLLLGGWALGAFLFARQLGTLLNRHLPFAIAGSAVAVLVLVVGVVAGTPLEDGNLVLVALQASTIVAAACGGLLLYRLVDLFEGRSVAVAAGVAAGLATPIGFWASIPKRHVLVVVLMIGAIYCFARSRKTGSLRFRAGAYAFAGLVAWIHAFEGFFLVATLASVDLATARTNGWRELAVVGIVLLLALSPTFATNAAISDNPLKSPRLLPSVGVGGVEFSPQGDLRAAEAGNGIRTGGGGGDLLGDDTGSGASDGTGDGTGGDVGAGDGTTDGSPDGGAGESGGLVSWLVGLLAGIAAALIGLLPQPPDTVLVILGFVLTTVTDGLAVLTQPERLWHVFVRSGRIPDVWYAVNQFEVIELTVLESMPLLSALAAGPVLAVAKIRRRGRSALQWPRSTSPARQTDLLVGALAVVFTVIYLSRVPVYSMLTVRYLMPVYLLGLYGIVRIGPVSGSISRAPRALALGYAATVVLGTVALGGALWLLEPALGEAVQLHGLVNLGIGTALALVVVGRTVIPGRVRPSWVAGALGIAAGVTTVYIVLAGLVYFPYGSFALDGARVLAEALTSLV